MSSSAANSSRERFHQPRGILPRTARPASAASPGSDIGLPGKERDEESGLNYHGARYYAPWLARWTRCDPRGIQAGINCYEYANNCPFKYTDLSGTQPEEHLWPPGTPRSQQREIMRLRHEIERLQRLQEIGTNINVAMSFGGPVGVLAYGLTEGARALGVSEVDIHLLSMAPTIAGPEIAIATEAAPALAQFLRARIGVAIARSPAIPGIATAVRSPVTAQTTVAPIAAAEGAPATSATRVAAPPPAQPPPSSSPGPPGGAGESAQPGGIPSRIYRGATRGNPDHVTLREGEAGVSFRDSISNPVPEPGQAPQPVLRPGRNYIEVDTSLLPPGSVVPDGGTVVNGRLMPEGHVSVYATPEQIVKATDGGGKFPR